MPRIRQLATITKEHKGGFFRCSLQDNENHEVIARCSGQMEKGHITVCVGDAVDVELSPYDLTRGRIVWRHDMI